MEIFDKTDKINPSNSYTYLNKAKTGSQDIFSKVNDRII